MIIKQPTVYALAGFTGFTGGDDVYPLIYYKATDDLFQTMEAIKTPIEALLTRIVATRGTSELQLLFGHREATFARSRHNFRRQRNHVLRGPLG